MATESDWDIVKTEVSDDGYMPQHPLCTALARLEAEHKRVVSERDSWRERAHLMQIERDDARSTTQAFRLEMGMALGMDAAQRAKGEHRVVAERLRADSERLAKGMEHVAEAGAALERGHVATAGALIGMALLYRRSPKP